MACQTGQLLIRDPDNPEECPVPFVPGGPFPSFLNFTGGQVCDTELNAANVPAVNTNAIDMTPHDDTDVQGQLDYLTGAAVSLDPWRRVGVVGAQQSAAQPVDTDGNLLVTDDIQHSGRMFNGGVVGDVRDASTNPYWQINSGAGESAFHIKTDFWAETWASHGVDAPNEELYGLIAAPSTVSLDRGYLRLMPLNDDGSTTTRASGTMLTDRFGNFGLHTGFSLNKQGSRRNFVMSDVAADPLHNTDPPAAPWLLDIVHMYVQTAGNGELFVMDGAGNVTQLSSHPVVAQEIMPHPTNITARYEFSFNVFSGIGQIKDSGFPSRTLLFNIDNGNYDLHDSSGAVLSSGVHAGLSQYGGMHPLPEGVSNRGQTFYDTWQSGIIDARNELIRLWDAGDESVREEFPERPNPIIAQPISPLIAAQFSMQPGNGVPIDTSPPAPSSSTRSTKRKSKKSDGGDE